MRDLAENETEREQWNDWYANRPRGVLSPKERKHLMGRLDEDPKENRDAIRQREYRIRQHIRHSILDFSLLCGSSVAQHALEEFYEASQSPPTTDERNSLISMVDFLFSGEDVDINGESLDWSDMPTFDSLLHMGVSRSLVERYAKEGISINPSVGFAINLGGQIPIEEVQAVYEQNESEKLLFPSELQALRAAGILTTSEFEEAMTESNEIKKSDKKDAMKNAYERRGREVVWKGDHFEDVTPE